MKPRVGISMGDPCGIGPEVVAKALRKPAVRRALSPVVFGDAAHRTLLPPGVELRAVSELGAAHLRPGKPTRAGGRAQLDYVLALVAAGHAGELDALCTAPVSKEAITKAGHPFQGHTELLADAFGVEVLMLMDGPQLRVALATNHLPLSAVPRALTTASLVRKLKLLSRTLGQALGKAPSIAVCGVNPHAGDGGVLGSEDARVIAPAVRQARRAGVDAHGPFAADGLFAKARRGFPYDVALAMFHDQGLVATKTLDFERTVNVTLGLPLPRTSPDHGVAYDIAGQGVADAQPMVAALLRAAVYAAARAQKTRR